MLGNLMVNIVAEAVDAESGRTSQTSTREELNLTSSTMPNLNSRKRKLGYFQFCLNFARELWEFRHALITLTSNKLAKRYQRSVLGFAWSLLNPLLTTLSLTIIFSLLFSRDPKSYGAFIVSGILVWSFIRDTLCAGCISIIDSANFHRKMRIPKSFFPSVTVATEFTNFVLSLLSMSALVVGLGIPMYATLLLLPVAMAITTVFVFGLTMILAIATIYFRDLSHIVNLVIGTLFYFTPIFYSLDQVPEKVKVFFLLNPFYYFVNLFKHLIYYGTIPSLFEWSIAAFIAFGTLIVSLFVLRSKENDIVFRL